MDYGTGAIFGCPSRPENFEFAKKYNLKITQVVSNNVKEKNCPKPSQELAKWLIRNFLMDLMLMQLNVNY